MRVLILLLLILVLINPFLKAFKDSTKFYQLPVLVSLTTIAFILPSLIIHVNLSTYISDQEYFLFVLNIILCLSASYLGYNKKYKFNISQNIYSLNKILIVISPFVFIGFYISFFLIDATQFGTINEGVTVIFIYFSRLLRPSAIIVFFILLIKQKKYALFLFILYLIVAFELIVISGRRSEIFTLGITLLLPLFFVKNYIPSKKISIVLLLIGASAFLILPAVREFTRKGDFNKIKNISFNNVIQSYYLGDKSNEILEAAINMNIVYENNGYSYGARFINKFTNQFVSGTLFGKDFKQSIQIEVFDLESYRNNAYKNSDFKNYLSNTGFVDTFYDFGFFSCIIFYFFATISKKLWIKAYHSSDIMHKMFYSYFVTMIFMSVYDSISFIPTNIILALFVFYVIKNRTVVKIKKVALN
ncbi:oligosaccharide repeat unit polymerase [Flavobacteriaceae bacterium]|nr:oligosaccharide repeat unit polymerase [Flavobacteriaceae bacterium]